MRFLAPQPVEMRSGKNASKIWKALAVFAVAIMIGSAFSFALATVHSKGDVKYAVPKVQTASSSAVPWTYPTTTMQEPNYTNGTYIMAAVSSVEHLNIYLAEDLYSFLLLDEIYDSPAVLAPNESIIPWLATGWSLNNVTAKNMTTFSPLTGSRVRVNYTYIVHIRPGVQWTDWTPQNANDTYVYSNRTEFALYNSTTGAPQYFNHTYSWPSVTMNTYTVQSGDFILSWLIMQSALDYGGTYENIVNVVPINNLTVEYELSSYSATFITYTLENPILPYHIWIKHDWATSNTLAWNYTGAPDGYDVWGLGYNAATGTASDLIGTGPYMMNGGYGMPAGHMIPGHYWNLFVNPHYFVQYIPSPAYQQWTPKFYQLYVPQYSSVSDAAAAEKLGQVYTIEEGLPPTFIPTIDTMPNTYIYHKPSSSYNYIQLNSRSSYSPLNNTTFRQALNFATNKAYISSVVDEGYNVLGQPAIPISDSLWYNFSAPEYAYNPQLALRMIASVPGMKNVSGTWYYNGKPVSINIQISEASEDPLGVEGAIVVQKDWNAIGIPTTITQESFTTEVANSVVYNFQAMDIELTGITGDPTGDFFSFYNTAYVREGFYFGPFNAVQLNGVWYSGSYINGLMNNLTVELNGIQNFTKRIAIAQEIEGIAAQESTIVNFGYPIDILEFTNTSFVGVVKDTLPYSSFMWWNFLSLHQRTQPVRVPVVTQVPVQLHVGVVTNQSVYTNGQYGNVTVQIRNQYGQPYSGASVTLGWNPQGAILNVTAVNGTSNAAGQFTMEFKVLSRNSLIYTSDYAGEVNFSASAFVSGNSVVQPGIGYTSVDITPLPVAYRTGPEPVLTQLGAPRYFNITVWNPVTNTPVSGYSYTIQVLSGALNMFPTSSTQTEINTTSYSSYLGFGYQAVNSSGQTDYNLSSISGITGSNGNISVLLSVNNSVNFAAMGSPFETWVFLGDYAAGGALSGEAPYDTIAQVTSSTNNNPILGPEGFGVQQPVELPVEVMSSTTIDNVSISLTISNSVINTSGSANVIVDVFNPLTHAPVPNYTVSLISQNALGANRGYFVNSSGTQIMAYNPNWFFGSTFLPGINLTTGPNGVANATFYPGLFTEDYFNGQFIGYVSMPFTDPYLIPFDEFQISAVGSTGVITAGDILSTQYMNNVAPPTVLASYVQGSSSLNGVTILPANSTHTLYVNSTLGTSSGPYTPNVPFTISVTIGNVSVTSGNTGSSGSASVTYTAPNVSVMTPVKVIVTVSGVSYTETIYLVPSYIKTVTVTKTPTTTTTTKKVAEIPAYMYGLLGLFIALTVVFAALFAVYSRRGKRGGKRKEQISGDEDTEDSGKS